jgi:ABC-type antimicrobial peptide transport system permease subunit
MVARQGVLLVGVGTVLGLLAAFFLANVVGALLFEVEAHDPVGFGGVTTVLGAIGLAAVAIPALRASRIDPVAALRGNG